MNGHSESTFKGCIMILILINVGIFLIQLFLNQYQMIYLVDGYKGQSSVMTYYFGLTPILILKKGFIWQLFSYVFLHSTYSFVHILFNMYALLIFGTPIEQEWGSKRFLFYYFFCGIGAGLTIFIINLINQGMGFYAPTIGASGAVFGLLLAFGILYPNSVILLFFILPVKAKYLVILYGGFELYLELFGGQSNISHIGHLGGLFFGLIYFYLIKKNIPPLNSNGYSTKIKNLKKSYESGRTTFDHKKDNTILIDILEKIKQTGYDSLSDDEIQHIKYLEIMKTDETILCNDSDFNINDDHCKKCEHFNDCFVREINKHR